MSGEKTLESLQKLGLNEYESKAFRSLSKFSSATPATLSKDSGIPRARIYDVLSSLETKGFVVRRPTRPVEYQALRLPAVYRSLERARTEEHARGLAEIKQITLALSSVLENAREEHRPVAEDAVLLSGRHAIYSRLAQEMDKCMETMVICSDKEGIERKKVSFSSKIDKLSAKGVKVRFTAHPKGRHAVFDENRVILFLNAALDDSKQERAIFLESPFLASALGQIKKP